jgi:hypothetical protein
MESKDDLTGLPNNNGVANALTKLRAYIDGLGVRVIDDYATPDHARFVGLFENHTITLYPLSAAPFACWFTIAHLYGHMTQLVNKTPRVDKANALVLSIGETLTHDDVQLIYDHEREAAEIGRTLVGCVEPMLSPVMDVAYSRFFHTDFRYLINAIETGERGPSVFARFWKREPIPRELIKPAARPLLDMHKVQPSTERIVVI